MEILKQELRTKVQSESKNSNLVDEFSGHEWQSR
jgi:hypothetical protein